MRPLIELREEETKILSTDKELQTLEKQPTELRRTLKPSSRRAWRLLLKLLMESSQLTLRDKDLPTLQESMPEA